MYSILNMVGYTQHFCQFQSSSYQQQKFAPSALLYKVCHIYISVSFACCVCDLCADYPILQLHNIVLYSLTGFWMCDVVLWHSTRPTTRSSTARSGMLLAMEGKTFSQRQSAYSTTHPKTNLKKASNLLLYLVKYPCVTCNAPNNLYNKNKVSLYFKLFIVLYRCAFRLPS